MGVYIKNLKMPKSSKGCSLTVLDDWGRKCIVGGKFEWHRDRLCDNCPLSEIQTPHGRLGDLDALELDAQKRVLICEKYDNQFQKPYELLRAIELAPTIIGEEGGKHD